MNSINTGNPIQNPSLPQASTAGELHEVDRAAARHFNSPLVSPKVIMLAAQLPAWDINRDPDDQDEEDEPEGAAASACPTSLSTKKRRMLRRFKKFVHDQDWRPGVTKHQQMNSCFLRAAHLGIPPAVAAPTVVEMIEKAGGKIDPGQIRRQLQRAYQYIQGQAAAHMISTPIRATRKASFSPEKLEKIARNLLVEDIEDFIRSRSPMIPGEVDSGAFLSHVFKHGENVVVFTDMRSQGQHIWQARTVNSDDLPVRGDDGVWYLVNPVDGEFHVNPREQKRSRRSEESVTDFRHLVLESDVADPVLWLKALVQLPLKIIAIYRSGGKSIHALVNVGAASKQQWDEIRNAIKTPLVTLGADLGALTAVRLSRLPQAWRGDRCQELLFLDPNPDGQPICNKVPCLMGPVACSEQKLEAAHVE